MTKIICQRCDWKGFMEEMELNDNGYLICPHCEYFIIPPSTHTLKQVIENDCIAKMRWHIKELGEDWVWNFIEGWTNPKIRVAYRKLFFEAGGKVPERK